MKRRVSACGSKTMKNNRLVLVERELVDGSIEGVYFGPAMQVIARSPDAVLVWKLAHSTSINGFRSYADPSLYVLPNRRKPIAGWLKYDQWLEGGRLSVPRIKSVGENIAGVFGEDSVLAICDAVRSRKTLLIEGGGPPLLPARQLGNTAFKAWSQLPEKGFLNVQR